MIRKIRLPTSEISKAYICPVCSKKKMFVLKFGELRGQVKKCENCGYTNQPA
jgi:rubredoxin